MPYDIFISYRRQDAEAHACMLFRDLTAAGYTVFFDHKSLGGGNFVHNIQKAIDASTDFLLLLSHEALSNRIYDPDDIMHKEIAYAFQKNKHMVGIMLSGFNEFPDTLPSDISELPQINCLYGKMEYYEAMFARLVSGQFLISIPRGMLEPHIDRPNSSLKKENVLEWFKSFDIPQKQQYMRFLLELAHEFNNSAPCMRLYTYLDRYDRSRGITTISDYDGVIPTDYATYLNFFETLYLVLITNTIDISLVDEMYRFRFFAACNNPTIQKSELLALGYQYPNIMELYDFWSEYIRTNHLRKQSDSSLADEYPQFERDLHSTYRLYQFAQQPQRNRKIRFINRRFERCDLTFQMMDPSDLQKLLTFQDVVLSALPMQKEHHIFEPLTESEFAHSLSKDICIGVYDNSNLAAVLSLIPAPQESQNLLLDLSAYKDVDQTDILIIDCILVSEKYRGFGLQRAFLRLSEFMAEKYGTNYICAVVSPFNSYSISNFIKAGFRLIGNRPKYHSRRDFFMKELSSR